MSPIGTGKSDTWGSLVRFNRERLGLTQQQLADRLGLSRKTIQRWEGTGAKPDAIALAIATIKVLGMDREAGLLTAGYAAAEGELEPDPYAYVRAMGLDPNGRVVRRILTMDISDGVRMAALRREKELQVLEEQRRLEDLEFRFRRADDAATG